MPFVWLIILILVLYWMDKKGKEYVKGKELKERQLLKEYDEKGLKLLFICETQYNKNLIFFHNEEDTVFEITQDSEPYIKFNASELRKVELYEDNTCAMSIGRAVVGGALFGGAGAIVGGSSGKNKIEKLTMIIYTKNIDKPQFTIPLIVVKTSKSSKEYSEAMRFARNVMGALEIVIDKNKEN